MASHRECVLRFLSGLLSHTQKKQGKQNDCILFLIWTLFALGPWHRLGQLGQLVKNKIEEDAGGAANRSGFQKSKNNRGTKLTRPITVVRFCSVT